MTDTQTTLIQESAPIVAPTREQWLRSGVDRLRPLFAAHDATLPPLVHVSIGFPSRQALSRSKRIIGQCWHGGSSADGNAHVFISPVLVKPFEIIDTLTHELVHVVTPGAGHKGKFVSVAKAIGLTNGKPTSAGAGPELAKELEQVLHELGDIPHVGLTAMAREKRQGTRMVKCACPTCGYTIRTTRKWLDVATPHCPVEGDMMTVG